MARAYEKYAKVFGSKLPPHPDINFVTKKGLAVTLKWEKPEYRAYKHINGMILPMNLGSCIPEPLKEYIERKW